MNRRKFSDKIASGVLLYAYKTYLKGKTERNCFLENFDIRIKLKRILTKKFFFAQTIFFLQFNVRSYYPVFAGN